MSKSSRSVSNGVFELDNLDTKPDSVTKTVVCPLETSRKKTKHIQDCVERWREITDYMSDMMISYKPHQWRTNISTHDYVIHHEFPDNNGLKLSCARTAANTVAQSYASWDSNGGSMDNHPKGDFGEESYIDIPQSDISVVENDRGFGVKFNIVPYDPIWFHINCGDYQREILRRIVDEEDPLRHGSGEAHLDDEGGIDLHLTYTIPVEIYRKPELDRWLGVDLGVQKMWVCSPVEKSGPCGAATFDQNSDQFRHTRERLRNSLSDLYEKEGTSAVKGSRQLSNYTDTMTHTASHEIVEIAESNDPCGIALEDLTGYRKSAENPIHDWPYDQLQEKIKYKANERGIPIREVDPAGTSIECWKCETEEYAERKDREWLVCDGCGDRRHADVNAAINIGMRAVNQ